MQKRNAEDRRRKSVSPVFPFKDANGATVRENRRSQPDRRLTGIEEGLPVMQDTMRW